MERFKKRTILARLLGAITAFAAVTATTLRPSGVGWQGVTERLGHSTSLGHGRERCPPNSHCHSGCPERTYCCQKGGRSPAEVDGRERATCQAVGKVQGGTEAQLLEAKTTVWGGYCQTGQRDEPGCGSWQECRGENEAHCSPRCSARAGLLCPARAGRSGVGETDDVRGDGGGASRLPAGGLPYCHERWPGTTWPAQARTGGGSCRTACTRPPTLLWHAVSPRLSWDTLPSHGGYFSASSGDYISSGFTWKCPRHGCEPCAGATRDRPIHTDTRMPGDRRTSPIHPGQRAPGPRVPTTEAPPRAEIKSATKAAGQAAHGNLSGTSLADKLEAKRSVLEPFGGTRLPAPPGLPTPGPTEAEIAIAEARALALNQQGGQHGIPPVPSGANFVSDDDGDGDELI